MEVLKSSKKVKDIAAAFGTQVVVKKVVPNHNKTKTRRHSAVLRAKKQTLNKVAHSNTSNNESPISMTPLAPIPSITDDIELAMVSKTKPIKIIEVSAIPLADKDAEFTLTLMHGMDTMYPMNSDTAILLEEFGHLNEECGAPNIQKSEEESDFSFCGSMSSGNLRQGSQSLRTSSLLKRASSGPIVVNDDQGTDYWIKQYNKANKRKSNSKSKQKKSKLDRLKMVANSAKNTRKTDNKNKKSENIHRNIIKDIKPLILPQLTYNNSPFFQSDASDTNTEISDGLLTVTSTLSSTVSNPFSAEIKKSDISTIDMDYWTSVDTTETSVLSIEEIALFGMIKSQSVRTDSSHISYRIDTEDEYYSGQEMGNYNYNYNSSDTEEESIDENVLRQSRSRVINQDMLDMLDLMSDTGLDESEDICAEKRFSEVNLDIGAIKLSDYIKKPKRDTVVNDVFASSQYYIDSEDEYHSEQEMYTFDIDSNKQITEISAVAESAEVNPTDDTNKESANINGFHERRESQIGMDLMDLMMSDSSSDESEDEMGISELLERFGLFLVSDPNIYSYFSDVLCIRYVYQMITILPCRIRRPKDCFNMKQLIKLHRLAKYVSVQCRNNVWNGKYSQQWIGVESNYVYNIWQHKSDVLMNFSEYMTHYNSITSSDNSDIISLNGFEKRCTHFLDINHFDKREIVFKLIIKNLPNKYRFENKLFKFGIETNDGHILNICDRLNIGKDDQYLDSIFLGKFIENDSFVFMKLKTIQSNDGKFLNINFSHQPNMQITRFDHFAISKDFQIKIEEDTDDVRVFVEQYEGNGQYDIVDMSL